MCRKRIKVIFAGKLNGLLIAEKACKQSNRKQTDISSVLEALQINIAGLFLTRVGLTFVLLPPTAAFIFEDVNVRMLLERKEGQVP